MATPTDAASLAADFLLQDLLHVPSAAFFSDNPPLEPLALAPDAFASPADSIASDAHPDCSPDNTTPHFSAPSPLSFSSCLSSHSPRNAVDEEGSFPPPAPTRAPPASADAQPLHDFFEDMQPYVLEVNMQMEPLALLSELGAVTDADDLLYSTAQLPAAQPHPHLGEASPSVPTASQEELRAEETSAARTTLPRCDPSPTTIDRGANGTRSPFSTASCGSQAWSTKSGSDAASFCASSNPALADLAPLSDRAGASPACRKRRRAGNTPQAQHALVQEAADQSQIPQQWVADKEKIRTLEKRIEWITRENKDIRAQLCTVVAENRALRAQNILLTRLAGAHAVAAQVSAGGGTGAFVHAAGSPSATPAPASAITPTATATPHSVPYYLEKVKTAVTVTPPSKKATAVAGATSMLCIFFLFGFLFSPARDYQNALVPLYQQQKEPAFIYPALGHEESSPGYMAAIEDRSSSHAIAPLSLFSKEQLNDRARLISRVVEKGGSDLSEKDTELLRGAFRDFGLNIPSRLITCRSEAVSAISLDEVGSTQAIPGANRGSLPEAFTVTLVLPTTSLGLNTSESDNSYAEMSCGMVQLTQLDAQPGVVFAS